MKQDNGFKFYQHINDKHSIGIFDEDDLIVLCILVVISFVASTHFLFVGIPLFIYYISVLKRKNSKGYLRNLLLLTFANKHHPNLFTKEFHN